MRRGCECIDAVIFRRVMPPCASAMMSRSSLVYLPASPWTTRMERRECWMKSGGGDGHALEWCALVPAGMRKLNSFHHHRRCPRQDKMRHQDLWRLHHRKPYMQRYRMSRCETDGTNARQKFCAFLKNSPAETAKEREHAQSKIFTRIMKEIGKRDSVRNYRPIRPPLGSGRPIEALEHQVACYQREAPQGSPP